MSSVAWMWSVGELATSASLLHDCLSWPWPIRPNSILQRRRNVFMSCCLDVCPLSVPCHVAGESITHMLLQKHQLNYLGRSSTFKPLEFRVNSATSNNMKLVHWPLMGVLLHLVQRWGDCAGPQPAQAPLRCTKCNSTPINGQCTNHRICIMVRRFAVLMRPLRVKSS